MHGLCKSVSDGARYFVIVLVFSLVLHGEAVAHVRKDPNVYVVATTTHTSPLVFHYLGFGHVDPVLL